MDTVGAPFKIDPCPARVKGSDLTLMGQPGDSALAPSSATKHPLTITFSSATYQPLTITSMGKLINVQVLADGQVLAHGSWLMAEAGPGPGPAPGGAGPPHREPPGPAPPGAGSGPGPASAMSHEP